MTSIEQLERVVEDLALRIVDLEDAIGGRTLFGVEQWSEGLYYGLSKRLSRLEEKDNHD